MSNHLQQVGFWSDCHTQKPGCAHPEDVRSDHDSEGKSRKPSETMAVHRGERWSMQCELCKGMSVRRAQHRLPFDQDLQPG